MRKNVLVTGGAGFIGSHLVDELIKRGHQVKAIDNLEPQVHSQLPSYLNSAADFIPGDIRDDNIIKKALKNVSIVIHLAAMVGVGQSMYRIQKYTDTNISGTAKLLEAITHDPQNIEKLVVASSMSIYGEGAYKCSECGVVHPRLRAETQLASRDWEMDCPICGRKATPVPTIEEKPLHPTSIYAITKQHQEEMCLCVGRAYNIPTVALRFFNTFGTRQSLYNPYTGVAAIFLSRIMNNQPPLIFEDGLQSRDFVSVYDVVQAIILAMERPEANYEVFNVGTGQAVTIREIAETLINLCHKDLEPTVLDKYRSGDIRHCYADISKIRTRLGYIPKVSLEDGMQELVSWSMTATAQDNTQRAQEELLRRGLVK